MPTIQTEVTESDDDNFDSNWSVLSTMRVGVLALIVNIAILLLAVIFERIIEKTLKLFSICRLKSIGRAPVIHDSYVWPLNIPRSILLLYKYPGKHPKSYETSQLKST